MLMEANGACGEFAQYLEDILLIQGVQYDDFSMVVIDNGYLYALLDHPQILLDSESWDPIQEEYEEFFGTEVNDQDLMHYWQTIEYPEDSGNIFWTISLQRISS